MPTVSGGTEEHQTATTFTETRHTARRFKAILFVLVTLLLWFVFALLSQAVVATVPRVGDCMRAQGVVGCVKTLAISTSALSPASETQAIDAQAENRRSPNRALDVTVLVISLLAALWAAARALYPPEDFDTLDPQTS
jgi:hypothetical protein